MASLHLCTCLHHHRPSMCTRTNGPRKSHLCWWWQRSVHMRSDRYRRHHHHHHHHHQEKQQLLQQQHQIIQLPLQWKKPPGKRTSRWTKEIQVHTKL